MPLTSGLRKITFFRKFLFFGLCIIKIHTKNIEMVLPTDITLSTTVIDLFIFVATNMQLVHKKQICTYIKKTSCASATCDQDST